MFSPGFKKSHGPIGQPVATVTASVLIELLSTA
jgi:hypothetical protein